MTANRQKVTFITVQDEYSGQRLDNFLLRELKGVPRSLIYRIVRRGEVRVNDGRVRAHARVRTGDQIRIPPLRRPDRSAIRPPDQTINLNTIFEDEYLLVVDKPAGIAVHAGSGIQAGLIEILRQSRQSDPYLELVHRLDRETSGCLLLAKRRRVLRDLHRDLRQNSDKHHVFRKTYHALVAGNWTVQRKTVTLPLRKNTAISGERMVVVSDAGQFAKSRFSSLRRFGHSTLTEIELVTGRTHQARVHAAACGYPILGDEKYGDTRTNQIFRSIGLKRLFLHAARMSFVHPVTTEKVTLNCPLPADLTSVVSRLEEFRPEVRVDKAGNDAAISG